MFFLSGVQSFQAAGLDYGFVLGPLGVGQGVVGCWRLAAENNSTWVGKALAAEHLLDSWGPAPVSQQKHVHQTPAPRPGLAADQIGATSLLFICDLAVCIWGPGGHIKHSCSIPFQGLPFDTVLT